MYAPYVSFFRTDRYMAPIVQAQVERFGTIVVGRLTELACGPPGAEEVRVTDRYRCRWLMTRYLKPTHRRISGFATGYLHFIDPTGQEWVFVVATSPSQSGYLLRLHR